MWEDFGAVSQILVYKSSSVHEKYANNSVLDTEYRSETNCPFSPCHVLGVTQMDR